MLLIFRPQDIPSEGRDFEFELDTAQLNERVQKVREIADRESVAPPSYVFLASPKAAVKVTRRGTSVDIHGRLSGRFVTPCSRCAEDTEVGLDVPVDITLKKAVGKEDEQEDLELGYYIGDEIELQAVVEEFAVLALPFSVLCSPACKGLCPTCGANLNSEICGCAESEGDERFAVLRGLKIQ